MTDERSRHIRDMIKHTTWISVKDRLPLDKEKIIFKGNFPLICKGMFEKSENGYEFLHVNEEAKKLYHIYGVTHWMPLPEPPK